MAGRAARGRRRHPRRAAAHGAGPAAVRRPAGGPPGGGLRAAPGRRRAAVRRQRGRGPRTRRQDTRRALSRPRGRPCAQGARHRGRGRPHAPPLLQHRRARPRAALHQLPERPADLHRHPHPYGRLRRAAALHHDDRERDVPDPAGLRPRAPARFRPVRLIACRPVRPVPARSFAPAPHKRVVRFGACLVGSGSQKVEVSA
ncbi:hypothetical protein SGPA1_30832 [Streptomyces misionensis JCM 4497]